MNDTTILRAKNPAVAEFIEGWRKKYGKMFDFTKTEDQALFYEGLVELARHIPLHASVGAMGLTLNVNGISDLRVAVESKASPETSAS